MSLIAIDQYNMSQDTNIINAKRILIDSVYKQANLEGIGVTYADTESILNNENVSSLTPTDISKVCCLRDGWKYVLDNIDKPLNLVFLEELHELVARFDVDYRALGKIRDEEVKITGTSWLPAVPTADDIYNNLNKLNENKNITDRALKTGLYVMRTQPFKDGNKRVGCYAINKILIENGKGLFNIPVEKDKEFKKLLVDYYETNNSDNILKFMMKYCLDGTCKIPNQPLYIEESCISEGLSLEEIIKIAQKKADSVGSGDTEEHYNNSKTKSEQTK